MSLVRQFALCLSNVRVHVVTSFVEGPKLLQPDFFQQRQFIVQIEIRVVLDRYYVQNLEDEVVCAKLIPLPLQLFVAVPSNRQHEFVAVERAFEVETASKKNLPICSVLHLEYSRPFLSFLVVPYDIFA